VQLLTMHNVTSSAQVSTSQVVDAAEPQSVQHHRGAGAGTAAGDMSLESSMTDDDSSRAEALRTQRQRRRRGADDVFPTRTLQRYQVCRLLLWLIQMVVVWSKLLTSLHC